MPYRHIHDATELCIICSAATPNTCQNCRSPHCDLHLMGVRCAGCTGELWEMEKRRMQSVRVGVGATVLPLALAVAIGGLGVPLALAVFLTTSLVVAGVAPPIVRRGLAKRPLKPSSRPLLPPVFDEIASTDNRESAYDVRRRRNKLKPHRRAPRAIFMTRGGHFYQ